MKKEIITLQVRVRVEYDDDVKGCRKKAIEEAKLCTLSRSTWGTMVSAKPLTAKYIKK